MVLQKLANYINDLTLKEFKELKDINIDLTFKDVLRYVRKIEMNLKTLSSGIYSGNYDSIFKGRGIEFVDLREYVYGDDIRNIDWKVSARENKAYVKNFVEERNHKIFLALDFSKSLEFGNKKKKKDTLILVASLILHFAYLSNDGFGMLFFSEFVEKYKSFSSTRNDFLSFVSEMIKFSSKYNKTSFKNLSDFLLSVVPKDSILIIISDFDDENALSNLKKLSIFKEVRLIKVYDKVEMNLSDFGFIKVYDPENNSFSFIDSNDKNTLDEFNKKEVKNQEDFVKQIKQNNMKVSLINDAYDILDIVQILKT